MEPSQQLEVINNKIKEDRKFYDALLSTLRKEVNLSTTNDLGVQQENVESNNFTLNYLVALLEEKKKTYAISTITSKCQSYIG